MTSFSVGISEFRANMSGFLQQVAAGNIVHLMYRGKEIAKVVPPNYAERAARRELAELQKTAVIGDILSPVNEPWEATKSL